MKELEYTGSKVKILCLHCGKEFEYYKSRKLVKFCSKQCHYDYNKGKSLEEIIGEEKAKKSRMKLHLSLSGEKNPNYGHRWNKEQREKCSIRQRKIMERPDVRYRCGSANRGKKFDHERCTKMGDGHKGIRHSQTSETKKKIGNKSKEKWLRKGFKEKFRNIMEQNGNWIPLNKKSDYDIYCKEANWKEKMFDKCSQRELNFFKRKGLFNAYKNKKGVVRDHKYSRRSGFNASVFPEILRHIVNCQIIYHKTNVGKKTTRYIDKDSLSLSQLFKRIEKYKGDWNEQELCLKLIKQYRNGERWERENKK